MYGYTRKVENRKDTTSSKGSRIEKSGDGERKRENEKEQFSNFVEVFVSAPLTVNFFTHLKRTHTHTH